MGKLRQLFHHLRVTSDVFDALVTALGRAIGAEAPEARALPEVTGVELLTHPDPVVVLYRQSADTLVPGFIEHVEGDGTTDVAWIDEATGQVWLAKSVQLRLAGAPNVDECVLLSRGDIDFAL